MRDSRHLLSPRARRGWTGTDESDATTAKRSVRSACKGGEMRKVVHQYSARGSRSSWRAIIVCRNSEMGQEDELESKRGGHEAIGMPKVGLPTLSMGELSGGRISRRHG